MSISTVFYHNTFNLLHPNLRTKTRSWLVARSSVFSRWWYPKAEQVSWHGGAVRDDGSGNGMYMTTQQAEEWPHWIKSNVTVGPS